MEQSLKDFNRALPKTETHLHIEGGSLGSFFKKPIPANTSRCLRLGNRTLDTTTSPNLKTNFWAMLGIISIAQTAIMSVPNRFSPIASLAMFATWRSASPRDVLFF